MNFTRIIEQAHRDLQEHRASKGLPPWDFSKPKAAGSGSRSAEAMRRYRAGRRFRKFLSQIVYNKEKK